MIARPCFSSLYVYWKWWWSQHIPFCWMCKECCRPSPSFSGSDKNRVELKKGMDLSILNLCYLPMPPCATLATLYNTVQACIIPYNPAKRCTVLCNVCVSTLYTVQHRPSFVQLWTIPCNLARPCETLCNFLQHCTSVQSRSILCNPAQPCTVLCNFCATLVVHGTALCSSAKTLCNICVTSYPRQWMKNKLKFQYKIMNIIKWMENNQSFIF